MVLELSMAQSDDGRPPRQCRICGCTETNCSGCVKRTGKPCQWVLDLDLCSACVRPATDDERQYLQGQGWRWHWRLWSPPGPAVVWHTVDEAMAHAAPLPLVQVSQAFGDYIAQCRASGKTDFELPPEFARELGWISDSMTTTAPGREGQTNTSLLLIDLGMTREQTLEAARERLMNATTPAAGRGPSDHAAAGGAGNAGADPVVVGSLAPTGPPRGSDEDPIDAALSRLSLEERVHLLLASIGDRVARLRTIAAQVAKNPGLLSPATRSRLGLFMSGIGVRFAADAEPKP